MFRELPQLNGSFKRRLILAAATLLFLHTNLTVGTAQNATSAVKAQLTRPRLSFQIGHEGSVKKLAVSPDGHWLATGDGVGEIKLWNLHNGDLSWTLPEGSSETDALVFSTDSRMLATSRGPEGVKLWNVETGRLIRTLYSRKEAEARPAHPLVFSTSSANGLDPCLWLASPDGVLQARDARTGKRLHLIKITGRLLAVAANATLVATVNGTGALQIWDMRKGKVQRTLAIEKPYLGQPTITAGAFSPDGVQLITGRYDGQIKLWDTSTGQSQPTTDLDLHVIQRERFGTLPTDQKQPSTQAVTSLVFSKSGKALVMGVGDHPGFENYGMSSMGIEIVTEIPSGRQTVTSLVPRGDTVHAVAITPDGKTLISSDDEATIRLWNTQTRRLTRTLARGVDSASDLAFSPDGGSLVTSSQREPARIWNLRAGRYSSMLQNTAQGSNREGNTRNPTSYTPPASVLLFSPDGRTLATGSESGTVQLWSVQPRNNSYQLMATLDIADDAITALAFSSDSHTLAIGSENGRVQLWREVPSPVAVQGHSKTPAQTTIKATTKTTAKVSARRLWKHQKTLTVSNEEMVAILGLAFLPGNTGLATETRMESMRIWNLRTYKVQRTLPLPGDDDINSAFSPDGSRFATVAYQCIQIWNLTTGRLERKLPVTATWIGNICFSADGKSVAAAASNVIGFEQDSSQRQPGLEQAQLKIWNVQTGALRKTLRYWPGDAYAAAFSPDGQRMAVCTREQGVEMWDIASGRRSATLSMLPTSEDLTFSSDWVISAATGHYAASAGASRYLRWQVGNQQHPLSKYQQVYLQPKRVEQTLAK